MNWLLIILLMVGILIVAGVVMLLAYNDHKRGHGED